MLRWFPRFQVATTCFSCSPPNSNSVVTNFVFCIRVKKPLSPGDNPIAVNNNNNNNYYYYNIIIIIIIMSQTKLAVFVWKDDGRLIRILPLLALTKLYTVFGQVFCLVLHGIANGLNIKSNWVIESVLLSFLTS